MKSLLNKKIVQYGLLLFFGLVIFSFPHKTFAACQLVTSGSQFRTYDFGSGTQVNWFQSSVNQNNAQPYIYLDMKFSPDCAGNTSVSFSIQEYDTLDPNDNVLGPFSFDPPLSSTTLERTSFFRAGDNNCDGGDSPDCGYFLEVYIDGEEYGYSESVVLSAIYDCHQSCDNQNWQYLGTVHAGNTPGYVLGNFFSDNDPDFISYEDLQTSVGTPDDEQSSVGTPDDEQSNTTSFEPLIITEQIENPLGDGSSLPAFIESLLGIIMRAGIPIIVLALVYTGFRFVEARGNPTKIADAKKLLLYTIIGSAVVLGAWTIATILTNTINLIVS